MINRRYFKTEKSYFKFLAKYKDKYKIKEVHITKKFIACTFTKEGE